jgi:hypothetical protein
MGRNCVSDTRHWQRHDEFDEAKLSTVVLSLNWALTLGHLQDKVVGNAFRNRIRTVAG